MMKPPFFVFLNFKLCRRGDMYTTDLLGKYFIFCNVLKCLLVAMFFLCFKLIYRLLGGFIQKNIKPVTNYNKRLTKGILT